MPIDMSLAKAPPKRPSRIAPTTSKSNVSSSRVSITEARQAGLEGIAQLAQGALLIGGQYADAATIGIHGPGLAKELAALAESNDVIAKPIDFLIQVGPYGALLKVVLPMAMQFLANHKVINTTSMFGSDVVPPEVLESRMKAQIMVMQAQALRDQQQAMREAKQAQTELDALMSNGDDKSAV